MPREYLVHTYFNRNGSIGVSNERREFDSLENMKPTLIKEYTEQYKDDKLFSKVVVSSIHSGSVDYELQDRMNATREMCELGHKVRAATKIRNRQPLRNAYVSFLDPAIQDYMIYIDCGKNDYADTIKDELNVRDVLFLDAETEKKIFDYNLKPNFRSLGPKGYGKAAQGLKNYLSAMNAQDRNDLYYKLKAGETITVQDIPLVFADIEVELNAKSGFMSASDKVGAIILDTTLDDNLLDAGFIADFRSAIQNVRKEAVLNVTDKIFLEVYCEPKRSALLHTHAHKLMKELLATDIKFFPPDDNVVDGHKFCFHGGLLKTPDQVSNKEELDKEVFDVKLYREGQSNE
jgi:isoleucyl-tRNA synthetase